MTIFERTNAWLGGYDVQNGLFIIAIVVTAAGMVGGSMLAVYIGASWVWGSLLSPVLRVHNQRWQMVIGIVAGTLFTSAWYGLRSLL